MNLRWALPVLALALAAAAHAEGYDQGGADPTPAAAALMTGKAHDWRRAPPVVKDRIVYMIFERNFPLKNEMSGDDMMACIDGLAMKAKATRPVETMVAECGGVLGYGQVD